MKKLTRFGLLPMILLAITLGLGACSKDELNPPDTFAQLRLINSVEGSSSQDFFQGDTKLNATAVAYGGASVNVNAKAGVSILSFRAVGTGAVTATENISIISNRTFNVFLHKRADGTSQIIGVDADQNPPESGKAKVRFLNLASSANAALSVSEGVTPIVTSLALRAATSYLVVNPGVNLNAFVVGSAEFTVINGADIQAGKNYTIWFDNSTTTKVKYFVVVDKA